jgi:UDP-N-acetylglucosamine acyltransferase
MISGLAIIQPGARLGRNVTVAPFAIVEDSVTIGDDCTIESHVVLRAGTEIGAGGRVGVGVVIGERPMDTAYQGEPTGVRIGRNNDIREYVTIHRSTGTGTQTIIGDDNLIMPYVHIAHNCRIGSSVTITNSCQLAGHVQVEDQAVLGGMTGIHQFTRVGACAMVGACSYLAKDLPPFLIGAGIPFRVRGINRVGLVRAGFQSGQLGILRAVYRIVYRSGRNLSSALDELEHRFPDSAEVRRFVAFARASKRGIQLRDPGELAHPGSA